MSSLQAYVSVHVVKADPRLYDETTSSLQTYVSMSSRQIRVSIPKLRHHCKPMSLCRQGRSASLCRNYVIIANLCLYVVKADPRLYSETRHHCKPMSLCRQGRSASLFRNYVIIANLCLYVVKADPRLYSETTSSLQTYVSMSSRQIRVSIPKLRHHCKPMSLCRQGRSASLFRNTSSLQTYVSMSSRQIRVSIPKLRHHCQPMSLCRQGRSASLFRNTSSLQTYVSMSSRQIRVSIPKLRHHCKPMSLCRQGRSASLFRNYVIIANLCLYVVKVDPRLYAETTSSLQTYVSMSSRQIRVSIPKHVIIANLCLYVVKADPRLYSETRHHCKPMSLCRQRQIRVSVPEPWRHSKRMSPSMSSRQTNVYMPNKRHHN